MSAFGTKRHFFATGLFTYHAQGFQPTIAGPTPVRKHTGVEGSCNDEACG